MSTTVTKEEALNYHEFPSPGKLGIQTTTQLNTQKDLSMAYTPGVAHPCLEIEENPENAFKYTAKRNLVAVITNGTAVLGLGNIGALAAKPVMEGKSVLFKKFLQLIHLILKLMKKMQKNLLMYVKQLLQHLVELILKILNHQSVLKLKEDL